jgi:GWxTD domain-containing protein
MMKPFMRILTLLFYIVLVVACSGNRSMSRFEIDYMISAADSMIVLDDPDSAALLINDLALKVPSDTLVLRRQGLINRELESVEGRIKSERAFRKLVEIDPDNADYHLELGKTLIAKSFEAQGRGELATAIRLDPTLEGAYLRLAELYRRPYFLNDYTDRADSALETLTQLLEANPHSQAGKVQLAELYAARGVLDSAAQVATEVLAADSSSQRANLVMGYVSYQNHQFEGAARYFERGLAPMDSVERAGYESILYLFPPSNAGSFMKLSPEKRDSLRKDLWLEIDTDPTTHVSERQVEHYARVWLANLLYSDSPAEANGWLSDMGETLIRLGPPDERYRGRIQSDRSNGVPTWYWYYTSTALPCTLAFVDHTLTGHYRFPFAYSDNTGSSRATASKQIAYYNYLQIPQESSFERSQAPINLNAGAYKFNSGDSLTEIQIVSVAPDSELSRATDTELRCVAFGKAGAEVSRVEREGELHPLVNASQKDSLAGANLRMLLPAGAYKVSLALDQRAANRLGVVTDSLIVPDYRGSHLAMSDIVLGYRPTETTGALAIVRNDTARIVPSIDQVFSCKHPLQLYFEAYNLPADIRSLSRFDVTYTFQYLDSGDKGLKGLFGKIFPGKKESVSYTYREGGKAANVTRNVELDVSELRPGRYLLTVKIDELVIGGTVSGRTDLVLLE